MKVSLEPQDSLLINPKEAAARLRVSLRTLFSLTKSGAIPCRHVGRLVRYAPDELREWIAAGCPTFPAKSR
jgi:excisionase family DNA binding protein